MTSKQTDIKNKTYYIYDLINIKHFDPNMLKLDKKQCQIVFIILVMSQKKTE